MRNKNFLYLVLVLVLTLGGCGSFESAEQKNPQAKESRAAFMSGKYGMMVHWLFLAYDGGDSKKIDANAAAFDIDNFMKAFDESGAEWLVFTIGQNTGAYASPNSVIEKYCGAGHCSKRDLVLEIAKAVKARGKYFIAYLPCEVRGNKSVREGFAWNDNPADPKVEFQKRYTDAVREWSLRLGELCDGWWFDGCYNTVFLDGLNWQLWRDAYCAGNKNAVAAFNPGIVWDRPIKYGDKKPITSLQPIEPDMDYLAGEVVVLIDGKIRTQLKDNTKTFMPQTALVPNTKCLYHALLPIDSFWGGYSPWADWVNAPFIDKCPKKPSSIQDPVYSQADLKKFYDAFSKAGAAATFNLGITLEGSLNPKSVEQLKNLK